jgi:RNA-directed DNA polymerase
VAGFQHKEEAEAFLAEVAERLSQFGLTLHSGKTRLIEFGRHAASRRKAAGLDKPETFTFLGLTYIAAKARTGHFVIRCKTAGKCLRRKLSGDREGAQTSLPGPGTGNRAVATSSSAGVIPLFRDAVQSGGFESIPL